MKNSDLRDKLEKLLYKISAGPEFMQFAQNNKQKINEYLIKNDLHQRRYHDNFSQKQILKTNVDRYVHAFKLAKQLGSVEMVYRKADFIFNLIGMCLNTRAFLGTIQMLGNQSQVQKRKKIVLTGQVFGSYGQTQLGHGSDVQHIISSTFEALISWKAVQISKQVSTRNNFAMFISTGIPCAYNYVISAPTYEGDNNVLLQQTARYILKQIQKDNNSKPQTNIINSDITIILPALWYVTQSEILRISSKIQAQAKLGIGANTTWNERLQRDIIDVARLWGNVQLLQGFVDSIQKIDQNLRQLFKKIEKVFIKNILKDAPQLYTYGIAIDESNPERQFSQQQYWAISHMQRPLFAIQQNHKFVERQGGGLVEIKIMITILITKKGIQYLIYSLTQISPSISQ